MKYTWLAMIALLGLTACAADESYGLCSAFDMCGEEAESDDSGSGISAPVRSTDTLDHDGGSHH